MIAVRKNILCEGWKLRTPPLLSRQKKLITLSEEQKNGFPQMKIFAHSNRSNPIRTPSPNSPQNGRTTCCKHMHIHDSDVGSYLDKDPDDPFPVFLISSEEKQRTRAPSRFALIVKALGKSLGFKYLNLKIRAIWKPQGDLQCIDLGLDYFFIRFKLKEDYWESLMMVPSS